MGFVFANLFLLVIIAIGAGLMWAVGAIFWRLDMPPDDHPLPLLFAFCAVLLATYYIAKQLHTWLARYVR